MSRCDCWDTKTVGPCGDRKRAQVRCEVGIVTYMIVDGFRFGFCAHHLRKWFENHPSKLTGITFEPVGMSQDEFLKQYVTPRI